MLHFLHSHKKKRKPLIQRLPQKSRVCKNGKGETKPDSYEARSPTSQGVSQNHTIYLCARDARLASQQNKFFKIIELENYELKEN